MAKPIDILVNGSRRRLEVDPERTLLSVLREDLGLTGSKYGCGEGHCGACTVLIDGLAARSCTRKIGSISEREIITIEGLAREGQTHPLQKAFLDLNAFQCGYCTPGMIMAGAALLRNHPRPTDEQIVEAMDRNICRCGTYPRVLAAIRQAANHPQGTKA